METDEGDYDEDHEQGRRRRGLGGFHWNGLGIDGGLKRPNDSDLDPLAIATAAAAKRRLWRRSGLSQAGGWLWKTKASS